MVWCIVVGIMFVCMVVFKFFAHTLGGMPMGDGYIAEWLLSRAYNIHALLVVPVFPIAIVLWFVAFYSIIIGSIARTCATGKAGSLACPWCWGKMCLEKAGWQTHGECARCGYKWTGERFAVLDDL